jgi:hypothetical protein
MQLNSINSGVKAYTSSITPAKVSFGIGTKDPQTPAERFVRLLRGFYNKSNFDGSENQSLGEQRALEMKKNLIEFIRKEGDGKTCEELVEMLDTEVWDNMGPRY